MQNPIIKLKRHTTLLLALFFVGTAFSGASSAAGLVKVKQTVFGMDCAPCAHGVEKGLEKLEGVKDATVSLNEGYAAVVLTPENSVTLEKIQKVVRENGFTPKDATVVISGTVAHSNDHQLVLSAGSGQAYPLSAAPENSTAWQTLQALPVGTTVEIKARLGAGETRQLVVLEVEPQV